MSESFFSVVSIAIGYGPVATSPFVTVPPLSPRVRFWSTVAASSL